MDSGYYAACAGLRARTQALEVVANNLANLNTSGYSSSQVEQRKVGKLATAIQTAFQQLGVFPGTDKIIVADSSQPISFTTVRAIEDVERTAAFGHLASPKTLPGASENGDLSSLRQELEDALASEIKKNEVAVTVGADGLVVSLREIGFFDSGSAKIRRHHCLRSAESPGCWPSVLIASGSKATLTTSPFTTRSSVTTGISQRPARRNWFGS